MNARGADPDLLAGNEEGEFCVRSEPNHTGKPRRLYRSPFQTIVLKVKQNSGEGQSGQLYAIYHRLAGPELPGSQGKTFKRCIPMQDCLLLMRKIISSLQHFLSLPGSVFFLWLWKLIKEVPWHQYSSPGFGLAPPSRPRSLLLLKQAVGWCRVTPRQPLTICCPLVATADTARVPSQLLALHWVPRRRRLARAPLRAMQSTQLSGFVLPCEPSARKMFLPQQRANREAGHLPWGLLPGPSQRAGDAGRYNPAEEDKRAAAPRRRPPPPAGPGLPPPRWRRGAAAPPPRRPSLPGPAAAGGRRGGCCRRRLSPCDESISPHCHVSRAAAAAAARAAGGVQGRAEAGPARLLLLFPSFPFPAGRPRLPALCSCPAAGRRAPAGSGEVGLPGGRRGTRHCRRSLVPRRRAGGLRGPGLAAGPLPPEGDPAAG